MNRSFLNQQGENQDHWVHKSALQLVAPPSTRQLLSFLSACQVHPIRIRAIASIFLFPIRTSAIICLFRASGICLPRVRCYTRQVPSPDPRVTLLFPPPPPSIPPFPHVRYLRMSVTSHPAREVPPIPIRFHVSSTIRPIQDKYHTAKLAQANLHEPTCAKQHKLPA